MRTYRNTSNSTFEPSEIWINIGYYVENPTTGEEQFVNLPKGGIALDSIEPEKVSKPETEYGKLVLAQNALIKQLKEFAESLEKGEAKRLPNLCIEIRRKLDSIETDDNLASNYFYKKII